jgi:hypothetical protein
MNNKEHREKIESCGHWSVLVGCKLGVSVRGRKTDGDFKCKWWK